MCASVRPHVFSKIEKAFGEVSYNDAVQNSSRYNNQLVVDRKTRLPFLDAQTGVAQRDCCLWMQKWERMPGTNYGQLYTYPSRRWKKKRRGYLLTDNYFFKRNRAVENQEANHVNGVDTQNKQENSEGSEKLMESITKNESKSRSEDAWIYADYDDGFDFEEDFDAPESDYDDSEEFSIGRKKKQKKERVKKKKAEHGDVEKPYICDVCDARYKTRPGLTYHYTHSHQNSTDVEPKPAKSSSVVEDEDSRQSRSNHTTFSNHASNSASNPRNTQEVSQNSDTMKEGEKSSATPSPYCDFCLGDSEENKKSKSAEKLISCSDCGRSAHPTCLQFTPQMILAIEKYRWQCIECKSCGICGTSDNDEQLLFCDDCDRGYHMYCLTPPLSEPPEGSWSCHLCIEEKKSES